MIALLNTIAKNISVKPRKIFLVDSFGASLSGLLLIFLIAPLETVFGIPRPIAISLSIPAFGFVLYSLICYLLNLQNWKPYLLLISIANFAYCCVTFGIMIKYFSSLKLFGILYFSGELLVILFLINIELMILKKNYITW